MLSMPPAMEQSLWPTMMPWAAREMAFRPEAQTLFTVVASVSFPRPALMTAWRAGDWPTPPWRTLPMYASWTSEGLSEMDERAPLMANEPSSGAVSFLSWPLKEPTGVRAWVAGRAS